jgi:hypothetical protein
MTNGVGATFDVPSLGTITINEGKADQGGQHGTVADQINGQVRETTAVCILRTIEQRVVEDDMTNVDTQSQDFLSIIDRIDTHKDRLVVSLNLAAITEPEAAHAPIPATLEIPFQRRQNGCAKQIIIAADNAPQQDPDLIALVADARRWASELLEGRASSIQHDH